MNIVSTVVDSFSTGSGIADATAKPIIAAGYASKAYKGVTVRCISGTVSSGRAA